MGGSKKSRPQPYTSGYRYYLSVQFVVSAGPVDVIHGLDYGERALWRGEVTDNAVFYINNSSLFGGEDSEGGVAGTFHFEFGRPTQGRNSFLQSITNAQIPAYRGFFTIIAQDTMWSSNNPYLKSLWARVTRCLEGWQRGSAWYPEKATISRYEGGSTEYTVTVSWQPQNIRAPQTIEFQVQTKALTDVSWATLATGDFSGGLRPEQNTEIGGQTVSGEFNSLYAGQFPEGERTYTFTLPYVGREFRIVKIDGSIEQTEGDIDEGVAFGGNVVVSNTFSRVPGYKDMNPAHILYQLLTEDVWQVRIPENTIDDDAWREAADTLHLENFGLSFEFFTTAETKNHIQLVLDHINAYFKMSLSGKLQLKLIRGNYDPSELIILNNSNSKLVSYTKTVGAKQTNELVVKYRDDNEDVKLSSPASNLASVAKFGIIKSEKEYIGVHTATLALNLAKRDLKVLGADLVRMKRTTSRVLWNHTRGDVVLITDEILNLVEVPYRIVDIVKNTESAGEITVEMVEDVFGYDIGTFSVDEDADDKFQTGNLIPVYDFLPVESPFYLLAVELGDRQALELDDNAGYAVILTTRSQAGVFSTSSDLYASLDDNVYQQVMVQGAYTPTGTLDNDISVLQDQFVVNNFSDFFVSNFAAQAEVLALVDDEIMAVDSYSDTTKVMTVRRGVLDTIPAEHFENAVVRIFTPNVNADLTTRLDGDIVYYKVQPIGNGNSPRIYDLSSEYLVFNSRAIRPYPPGRFAINGQLFAEEAIGPLTLSWAHRDRTLQTTNVVPHEANSIGPEPMTVYNIQVFDNDTNTLKATYSGVTAASKVILVSDIIGVKELRVTLESQRDSFTSWQKYDHVFTRYGYGLRYGAVYGK